MSKEDIIYIKTIVKWSIVSILCAFVIFGTWYIVNPGERAILLTLGNPSPMPSAEGLHFKFPIVQSIVIMNVQTQKYEVAKASAASKDLQTVTTDVTINYLITPDTVPELYKNVGVSYQEKVIAPAVQEVVKATTSQYTAEELITKRAEVKEKMDIALRDRLATWNINVQSVAITNFDFSSEFNKAIEAKVTAEQNALAAKNKLAQVEYEKLQRITQAEGESEAIKIQAQAIQSQGGKDYVQLQAINKWDGHLPVATGSGAIPFINIQGASSITTTTA
jgi:regulator of protease activity HflC (stomatin/prohibitin superfamily)